MKLAEFSNCLVLNGGLPCLVDYQYLPLKRDARHTYLTRSASVNGCNGRAASRAISPSVTSSVLSGDFRCCLVEV